MGVNSQKGYYVFKKTIFSNMIGDRGVDEKLVDVVGKKEEILNVRNWKG